MSDEDALFVRFVQILLKAKSKCNGTFGQHLKVMKYLTMLWNWVDHRSDRVCDHDSYWKAMVNVCPWAFEHTNNTNSMIFTYAKDVEYPISSVLNIVESKGA